MFVNNNKINFFAHIAFYMTCAHNSHNNSFTPLYNLFISQMLVSLLEVFSKNKYGVYFLPHFLSQRTEGIIS